MEYANWWHGIVSGMQYVERKTHIWFNRNASRVRTSSKDTYLIM